MKFFYNGIKDNNSKKLQKVWYSKGNYTSESGIPQNTITIYNKDYSRFSEEVKQSFKVENNSDIMTDYFEKDRIRVTPSHSLYAQVNAAYNLQQEKCEKKWAKRKA